MAAALHDAAFVQDDHAVGATDGGQPVGDDEGGAGQRVAVGRALAPSPDLLLLDEPFSALDAPTREALVAEFASLRSRLEMPAVLVTHDVAEAYALADHLLVLEGGRVLQSGARDAVFHAPSSPSAARLLGVRNLLAGVVVSVTDGTALVDAGGLRAAVPLADAAVGGQVTLGVRAQDVVARPAPNDGDGGATLEREVDAGIRRTLALRLPGAHPGNRRGPQLAMYQTSGPGTG